MKKYNYFATALILSFLLFFYFSIENVNKQSENKKFDVLTDAIIKSAVQAYAIEGFYPPNIAYLEENYGLIVDHEKYVISYNVFASNLMPEIEIFLK